MTPHRAHAILIALCLALGLTAAAQAAETLSSGDIEVHVEATPTNELSPEAAQRYNITPSANRGMLTVTVLRKGAGGKASTLPAQVYAGATTKSNYLINIPVRERREPEGVYYLGEFYVTPNDTLTFLVNVNVLGQPFKAKFSRVFHP